MECTSNLCRALIAVDMEVNTCGQDQEHVLEPSTHWSEHTPYYPYGQEGPGYAPLIPNQEMRDILVRLERLEEENRRLWEAMRYIPGTPMWQS